MSTSPAKGRQVVVPVFLTPHVFWFIEAPDNGAKTALDVQLHALESSIVRKQTAENNDPVLVVCDDKLERAVVKKTPNVQMTTTEAAAVPGRHICWLIDRAVLVETKDIFEMPDCVARVAPVAKRACIVDLISEDDDGNCCDGSSVDCFDWNVISLALNTVCNPANRLAFTAYDDRNGVQLGKLLVVSPDDESFHLTDLLLQFGSVRFDAERFDKAVASHLSTGLSDCHFYEIMKKYGLLDLSEQETNSALLLRNTTKIITDGDRTVSALIAKKLEVLQTLRSKDLVKYNAFKRTLAKGMPNVEPPEPKVDLYSIEGNDRTVRRACRTKVLFRDDVQECLKYFDYVRPHRTQIHTWPCVMLRRNVTVVDDEYTGKSLCYLPGLLTFLIERQPVRVDRRSTTNKDPYAIVLCPNFEVTQDIYTAVLKLTNHVGLSDKRHVVLGTWPVVDKSGLLDRGCDVLVTTPTCLYKMLKYKLITFGCLCYFVAEDVDVIYNRYETYTTHFLELCRHTMRTLSIKSKIQTVFTARVWSESLKKVMDYVVGEQFLCVGNRIESALYNETSFHMVDCCDDNDDRKIASLLDRLKECLRTYKTCVVVCKEREAAKLHRRIVNGKMNVKVNMPSTKTNEHERRSCALDADDTNFVLLCTDQSFVRNAVETFATLCLIHYSYPADWKTFVQRFNCLAYGNDDDNDERCKVVAFVDRKVALEFPKLVDLTRRLDRTRNTIDAGVVDLLQNLERIKEAERQRTDVELCVNVKQTGRCPGRESCERRHALHARLDRPVSDVPSNGHIKFLVTHVETVTRYYVRIIEHVDMDKRVKTNYALLQARVFNAMATYYKSKKNRTTVRTVSRGMTCATRTGPGVYERCVVTEVLNNNTNVSVRLLESGTTMIASNDRLLTLPADMKVVPPLSVELCLLNVGPPEGDTHWDSRCRDRVADMFVERATFAMSDVVLQLGGTIWVRDVQLYKKTDDDDDDDEVDDDVTFTLAVRDELLSKCYVEERPDHLDALRLLCRQADIAYNVSPADDDDDDDGCVDGTSTRQSKPRWVSFDKMQTNVPVFLCGVNGEYVYVRLTKYHTRLLELTERLRTVAVKKSHDAKRPDVVPGNCYVAYDERAKRYGRALVLSLRTNRADCYFVDYGDRRLVYRRSMKQLPDDLIKALPFQSIECRLFGIKPIKTTMAWSNEARTYIDSYRHVGRGSDSTHRTLHVNPIVSERTDDVVGAKRYAVILSDVTGADRVVLNRTLLELRHARSMTDENVNGEMKRTEEQRQQQRQRRNCRNDRYGKRTNDDDDGQNVVKRIAELLADSPVRCSATFSSDVLVEFDRATVGIKSIPPPVTWYEVDNEVKLAIQMPARMVKYDIVLDENNLQFQATHNDKHYFLLLNLFDGVSNCHHYRDGLIVRVDFKKKNKSVTWTCLTRPNPQYEYYCHKVPVNYQNDLVYASYRMEDRRNGNY